MTAQDRSDWFTVPVLAAGLGVSQATLKRRIRDGKPVQIAPGKTVEIEVELLERPQGHEYRVRVKGQMPALSTDQPPAVSKEDTSAQEQSRALDILDAVLRANADTMDKQAERLDRYADLLWQETAKRAAADEHAIAADRRADRAERERAAAQDALTIAQAELAERTNLSHAEAARIFEEARQMREERDAERARADDLAARLQAEAERQAAGRPWWEWWR